MLAAARKSLGLVGRPNYISRDYAKRHGNEFLSAPWCAMAVTYWSRESGNAQAVLPKGDRAYTVWHAEDGRNLGRWHAGTAANIRAHARPGAIVFFDWDGTDSIGRIDHVGVCEVNLGDGRMQTIEGNTGDACKRRVRGADVIAGFWNPDYEEDDVALSDADLAKIANKVYERFTHEVTADTWAAKEKILDVGQKVDPRTSQRQTWAYGKDAYHMLRKILALLESQGVKVDALTAKVDALAAVSDGSGGADPSDLIDRIRTELDNVSITLAVGK
jgi:hypothetical protein